MNKQATKPANCRQIVGVQGKESKQDGACCIVKYNTPEQPSEIDLRLLQMLGSVWRKRISVIRNEAQPFSPEANKMSLPPALFFKPVFIVEFFLSNADGLCGNPMEMCTIYKTENKQSFHLCR